MAIAPLKNSYGDMVRINYLDVSSSKEAFDKVAEMSNRIGYPPPLPAVTVNGRLVQEGWVSFYELGEIIERILGKSAEG